MIEKTEHQSAAVPRTGRERQMPLRARSVLLASHDLWWIGPENIAQVRQAERWNEVKQLLQIALCLLKLSGKRVARRENTSGNRVVRLAATDACAQRTASS